MICCIGHITHDRVITPSFTTEMPGGTAYYFAKALQGIAPGKFRIVTSVGEDEQIAVEELRREGIDVRNIPGETSVFFENRYGADMDDRTQRVLCKAAPFCIENLKEENADYFHLGTLLDDDFELEVIKNLSTRGKVSVDIQGYLRRVENEEVVHQDYAQKKEMMPYISILKANEKEMEVLTGTSDPIEAGKILSDWGCKEVVLTLGSKGSIVHNEGKIYEIPAYSPTSIIDATGCGDTYMAGYLLKRSEGEDIETSGRYAAAMCTLKLANKGPLHSNDKEIKMYIKKSWNPT